MLQTPAKRESFLDTPAEAPGQPQPRAFREHSSRLGAVYTMSYTRAVVAMYDYDREQAGGAPKNMFLLAAKITGDESFILLRVQDEACLPNAADNDLTRQKGVEASKNEESWANSSRSGSGIRYPSTPPNATSSEPLSPKRMAATALPRTLTTTTPSLN